MIWRNSIIIAAIFFFSCKPETKQVAIQTEKIDKKVVTTQYLIEATDLQKELTNIKFIDFRKPKFYKEGHIKGAINIWRTDINNNNYSYKGMMPSKKQIETLFSNLGIKTQDTLVIYDNNGECDSARLWWILQNYNYTNVTLLNGGISAWKSVNGATSKNIVTYPKTNFKLPSKTNKTLYASKEDVLQAIQDSVFILDTRTTDEYTGKRHKKGAFKAGRIPNSKLLDWANAVNYNGDKKIKTKQQLEKIYNKLNLKKNDSIIVYCHSGVRSAHTTFILTQILGYTNVKNYDGSWTEWSHFENLPFKKDSTTTIQ